MKKMLLLFCMGGAVSVHGQTNAADQFSGLRSLQGTWVIRDYKKPGQSLYEWWTLSDDSTLSGLSFLVPEKDTTVLEIMKITLRGGQLQFEALNQLEQQQGVVNFPALPMGGERTIFENKQHDFPQRIIYEWPVAGTFRAAIEGPLEGKDIRQEYHFRKVDQ